MDLPVLSRLCLAALVGLIPASDVEARSRRPDPSPFAHRPCSVYDPVPCAPTFCSVYQRGPCLPEIFHPYGENLQLTVLAVPPPEDAEKYRRPDHDLDTIADLFAALRACWSPPDAATSRDGMQMTLRFSFRTSGALIGSPRVTFASPGVPADARQSYLAAITGSLQSCLPLKFTRGLAGALAGRPIMVRYVDNRVADGGTVQP